VVMPAQARAQGKKWRSERVGRVERPGGASLVAHAGRVGGGTSPPPALVARIARRHQGRAEHFHRLRRARQAPAVSADPPAPLPLLGVPALDFRALGADPPALAAAEAADGPSSRRSSPGGGRDAVDRSPRLVPSVNCPSASDRGRRGPAGTNAGVKRACGRLSCRSCFRLRLRSCLRLEPCKWDCRTKSRFVEHVARHTQQNGF
jgi:hypothetical protein